jgi:YD repeat-containing protein
VESELQLRQIGNRKTSTGIESVTYTANALNQYADIQVSSLSSQPFYDLDGNLTGDGGNWTYNWNNENRLASATDGSRTIHFTYDYQGRLVKKDDGRSHRSLRLRRLEPHRHF